MAPINPVAPYKPSNFTAQTAADYKNTLDSNSVAAQRIVTRFAPHSASPANMTVVVDQGSVFDGKTLSEIAPQTTPAFAAPVNYPRIDRVVVDAVTGALQVVSGAEATSPTAPAIPNGKHPVAQVYLTTNTTAISNAAITDERNFSSGGAAAFGAQAPLGSAATCDLGTILSRNVLVTGTTTITSFGASANTASPIYLVEFAAGLTLKNGGALALPGGADIAAAGNDTAIAEYLGGGNWRVRSFHRADGSPTLPISGLLDEITTVVGAVLFRGTTGWIAVGPPPSAGYYLNFVGQYPAWSQIPDATNAATISQGIIDPLHLANGSPSASTFVRGDGTWATPPSASLPTTAGAVGTYAFLFSNGPASFGSTYAGSTLYATDASGTSGAQQTGTWRCMGSASVGGSTHGTLYLRIA